MKTLIRSSSNILSHSGIIDKYNLKNRILFSDYGELFSNLKTSYNNEAIIVFLQDLIDIYNINKKNNTLKIKIFLKNIEYKLKNKSKKFILLFSTFDHLNVLNNLKHLNSYEENKKKILNQLYKLTKKNENFYLIDLDKAFATEGYNNIFDNRNYYLTRCRLSLNGLDILFKNIKLVIERIYVSNKKILLLDCDNTLWGGVLGEDGFQNITIGTDGIGLAFLDFQKTIKYLKNRGILLGLVSKNDENDVKKVLKEHSSMILKNSDITTFKVNWNEKYKNIKEISEELSLGLDSFVFWDDNPVEREKVRINLKDLEVIEPDKDISNWSKQLLEYPGFTKFKTTKEDLNKTKQYKNRSLFISNKNKSKNETEYLKSISLKPSIVRLAKDNLQRAEQLCQKTNQFNFTTKRYNIDQLRKLNKTHNCFLVSLSDIYGYHGLIALLVLKDSNKEILIDTFIMSCRILGRNVENWILYQIVKIAKKKKIKFIYSDYKRSEKNLIAKNFLENNNFKKVKLNGTKKYKFDISNQIKNISHFNENYR